MLALLFIAASVGLDNFGASTAIGIGGVDRKLRARVVLIFGLFESSMPVVGILLGHSVSRSLGTATKPVGGGLLILVGAYAIVAEFVEKDEDPKDPARMSTKRLLLLVSRKVEAL